MKKALLVLAGVAAVVVVIQGQQPNENAAIAGQFSSGEMLVQFKANATPADKGRALGRANAEHLEDIAPQSRRADGRGDLVLVRYQPDFTPAAARRALASDPAVEFAEPNWIYTHQATSNDPYYTNGSLWGMYGDGTSPTNEYGSQAGEAWAAGNTGSATVYIGIIDEGVQWAHQDLSANIWTNPFDPVDGIDNDGNGYKDDIRGWDFDGNNNSTYDGTQDDHGTHVAGDDRRGRRERQRRRGRGLEREADHGQISRPPRRHHCKRHQSSGLPDQPQDASRAEYRSDQ